MKAEENRIGFFQRVPSGFLAANCYIIGGEGAYAAVIDPGADYARLKAALDKGGRTAAAVLLTHGHFDHIGAAAEFQRAGAKIYMHEGDRHMAHSFAADVYVSDGDVLEIAGLCIKVIHTPGHSPGGVCYYTCGALFSGDTLFRGDVGRTDLKGGDYRQIEESVRYKLYSLPDETGVFPGHGGETAIGREKRYNHYIKE